MRGGVVGSGGLMVAVAGEGVGRRLGFRALDADGRLGDRGGGRWRERLISGGKKEGLGSEPGGGVARTAVPVARRQAPGTSAWPSSSSLMTLFLFCSISYWMEVVTGLP